MPTKENAKESVRNFLNDKVWLWMRLGPEWAFDIVHARFQWMTGREIWTWASLVQLEDADEWWTVLVVHRKMNGHPGLPPAND